MKHFFFKGSTNILSEKAISSIDENISIIKKELAKVLESRNLSFLIGSGCSTGKNGIPTMAKLAEVFFLDDKTSLDKLSPTIRAFILSKESKEFLNEFKIDFKSAPFKDNLEIFLGTLFSLKFYYAQIKDSESEAKIDFIIVNTQKFILYQCLNSENTGNDADILDNYKTFYRKLSLRDSNLPKPNIFTTNYDLYSEKAMDELGVAYTNGFSGFIERYFNPSIFNYALAEQMDLSTPKWRIIDSFVYLFKIHGSVNWVEETESNKLFQVKEVQPELLVNDGKLNLMIYPSPIKQNASLGTPYSDLFREFQKRIAQNQSILVTMGYSFSDEHINNLIYQALTIPTFRLVIFSESGYFANNNHNITKENIEKLKKLNDPRIWIIGSDKEFKDDKDWEEINEDKPLYFFKTITDELLPDWAENQIEDKNAEIINLMKTSISSEDLKTNISNTDD